MTEGSMALVSVRKHVDKHYLRSGGILNTSYAIFRFLFFVSGKSSNLQVQ